MKMYFGNLGIGRLSIGGYPKSLIDLAIEKDFLDAEKYHLFASQFLLHSDQHGSWRGEFWGKFVRGACECYKASANRKLYKIIEDSVMEVLGYVEKDGTLSSYVESERFTGWDIWGRKYAMVGFLSYAYISKSKAKQRKVIASLKKQANAIMRSVGKGKGKKGILETSSNYGSLNSSSILGVFLELYRLTGAEKYLDFASYIVASGLSKGEDLVNKALEEGSYPYEWQTKKAYEMIACFQGLLHYALAVKEQKYLDAVITFVKKIQETDFTVVGGIGTESEFFNHSSLLQTEPSIKPGLETCVTVSFMSLCLDLLRVTGDSFYASLLETMSYNALFGAVNDLHQNMSLAEGRVWRLDGYDAVPHEAYLFDSYSPLVNDRRGKLIGGFMTLQNGRSFGCCPANGGYGLGLVSSSIFLKKKGGYAINFYEAFKANDLLNGKKITISLKGSLYQSGSLKLLINGKGERFDLMLRIPKWGRPKVVLNGAPFDFRVDECGYMHIDRVWEKDALKLSFSLFAERLSLNGKIAYRRGPIVLAYDNRFGERPALPKRNSKGRVIRNIAFKNNVTVEFDGGLKLCDYGSAAKNLDEIRSGLSVWLDEKEK